MYGEEFVQNSINAVNNRDDVHSVGNNSVVLENKTNNLIEAEVDQKSKSKPISYRFQSHDFFHREIFATSFSVSDNQTGQFSGGDEDTEAEDQVDHAGIDNGGFPNYNGMRGGFSKGDFSFGENELDMELDAINSGKNYLIRYTRGDCEVSTVLEPKKTELTFSSKMLLIFKTVPSTICQHNFHQD